MVQSKAVWLVEKKDQLLVGWKVDKSVFWTVENLVDEKE
jgi:hypothetical protein